MTPEQILQKTRDTYRGLKSYSDSGAVDVVHVLGKKSLEFRTHYKSPGKIRFEWNKKPRPGQNAETHWICSNADQTFMWFRGQLESTDLKEGLAYMTGISSGSVLVILSLLLPEKLDASQAWYEMRDVMEFEDEEEINGHVCHHLTGTTIKRDDTDCWISRDDFVVRRLTRKTDISANEANKMLGTAMELLHKMGDANEMFSSSADVLEKIAASEQLPRQLKSDISYMTIYNYLQVQTKDEFSEDVFNVDPALLASRV